MKRNKISRPFDGNAQEQEQIQSEGIQRTTQRLVRGRLVASSFLYSGSYEIVLSVDYDVPVDSRLLVDLTGRVRLDAFSWGYEILLTASRSSHPHGQLSLTIDPRTSVESRACVDALSSMALGSRLYVSYGLYRSVLPAPEQLAPATPEQSTPGRMVSAGSPSYTFDEQQRTTTLPGSFWETLWREVIDLLDGIISRRGTIHDLRGALVRRLQQQQLNSDLYFDEEGHARVRRDIPRGSYVVYDVVVRFMAADNLFADDRVFYPGRDMLARYDNYPPTSIPPVTSGAIGAAPHDADRLQPIVINGVTFYTGEDIRTGDLVCLRDGFAWRYVPSAQRREIRAELDWCSVSTTNGATYVDLRLCLPHLSSEQAELLSSRTVIVTSGEE